MENILDYPDGLRVSTRVLMKGDRSQREGLEEALLLAVRPWAKEMRIASRS